MTLTKEQLAEEFNRIHENRLDLDKYIRFNRKGANFTVTRKDRKEIFAFYVETQNKKQGNRMSENGMRAYNEITRRRDEESLLSA